MQHQTLLIENNQTVIPEAVTVGDTKKEVIPVSPIWEEYNEEINKNYQAFRSYTDCYFEQCHLNTYMTTAPATFLQLGSAGGHFLLKQQSKGYEVMGYDYSHYAVDMMQQHGIPHRQIDLNELNETKTQLAYYAMLKKDLSEPCNIIAVRVLNYLDLEVASILLNTLIELARPGSTFFLISRYTDNAPEQDRFPLGYQFSFFAKRPDMKICLQTTSKELLTHYQKELMEKSKQGDSTAQDDLITLQELDDILVVRKLGV